MIKTESLESSEPRCAFGVLGPGGPPRNLGSQSVAKAEDLDEPDSRRAIRTRIPKTPLFCCRNIGVCIRVFRVELVGRARFTALDRSPPLQAIARGQTDRSWRRLCFPGPGQPG